MVMQTVLTPNKGILNQKLDTHFCHRVTKQGKSAQSVNSAITPCNLQPAESSQNWTMSVRIYYTYQNKLCYSCLEGDHFSTQCQQQSMSLRCKGKHPTSRHNHYNRTPNPRPNFIENRASNPKQEPKLNLVEVNTPRAYSNPVNSNNIAPEIPNS